ncbi:hypothetical protein [Glycomyces tenuis]|uniref:hypothetical protein n=1 Tax=Glycomyces tenuis TaxID=58116 RepID=UPI0012DFAC9E|nr:hypothetical protein [Glycomyces tenuis]
MAELRHYGGMATFNVNKQTVHGNSYVGDTFNITHGEHSPIDARTLAVEFDRALAAVRELEVDAETREKVSAELVAARADLKADDRGAARKRFDRVIDICDKATGIVTRLAGAVGGLSGG